MNYGLLVLILFPVVAGFVGYILGKKDEKRRNDWIDIAMFVQFVLLVCLAVEIIKGWDMSFVANAVFGLGFSITLDPVRLMLCGVVLAVNFIMCQYMKESMKKEQLLNIFYLLFMCIQGVSYGAILSDIVFCYLLFMVGGYILLIPIMLQRQDDIILKNAKRYSILMAVSFGLVMVGMLLLFAQCRHTSFAYLLLLRDMNQNAVVTLSGILLIFGFSMWAGMFPFHHMVARSSNVGLIEVSTISACVLSKIGILGMFLMARSIFQDNSLVSKILLVWALLTIVCGLFTSLVLTDIRKMLMGINIAVNGMIGVSGSVGLLKSNEAMYPLRGFLYLLVASSLALLILYMVALQLVREARTYEIKGLIAVGKGHKLLMVISFIACGTLIGLPGTFGFLGQSMVVRSLLTVSKWKWLIVLYLIQWGFFVTAVARYYMKLFVSKKDETMVVLSSEEELEASNPKKEPSDPRNAYWFGEVLLGFISFLLVAVGVFPQFTIDKLSTDIDGYFYMKQLGDNISYYTVDVLVMFAIAAVLGLVVYVTLVHGILLRYVRDRKNKKLRDEMNM
ncbi:MAG: proton-conducting transporter membrane subunit [Lachnospiraceae bacterium]